MRRRIKFTKVNGMSNQNERLTGWWMWLRSASDGAQQQEIAANLEVTPATVTGWKNGGEPHPKNVIAAARAYGPHVGTDLAELFLIAYTDEDTNSGAVPKGGRTRKGGPEARPRLDAPPL